MAPANEIRKKFLEFFEKLGHAVVPSSSLVPTDPSVLLTTAGMQQFKKYYTGELDAKKDFGSLSTASIQKCFRTSDIDEVGDESHLTFFEMLGNFSFGGYFSAKGGSAPGGKEKAIKYGYDFITKEMGLEIDYVTVFDPAKVIADDWRKGVSFDKESHEIWKKFLPESKIWREGTDNFWGPTGTEGPCGPTTEIYANNTVRQAQGKPSVEIWNIVFNQFYCTPDRKLTPLKIQGIDTGMGLERLAMIAQNTPTIFETDLFTFGPLLYGTGNEDNIRRARIMADHLRASVFLLADGVRPSNKDAGYILRRLIRRLMVHRKKLSLRPEILEKKLRTAIDQYCGFYGELKKNEDKILSEFRIEAEKFNTSMERGLAEFYKSYPDLKVQAAEIGRSYQFHKIMRISGKDAFNFYQSYGLTPEVIQDLARDGGHIFDEEEFDIEFKKHQEISRAGQEKKFGGHGLILNTGELKAGNEEELKKVLRLHTATHLLQAALRKVLGSEVEQRGSDITAERTRFDFSFSRKITVEEIKKTEDFINDIVAQDLPVNFEEMSKEEAAKTSALFFFKEKYPERVKVYYVGKDLETAVSKEFCGGPHVSHTSEIGRVKITKEEAIGAGVRRIRATVE